MTPRSISALPFTLRGALSVIAFAIAIALISIYVPLDNLVILLVGLALIAGVILQKQGFLYLMLFLAAFEWLVFPKDGAFLYYVFETVIVAAAVGRVFFRGEAFTFPPRQLFTPIVIFIVWVMITIVLAVDVSTAAISFIFFMASVVTFLIAYLLIDSPVAMRRVLIVQLVVALLFVIASLYERAILGSTTIELGHMNVNVLGNYAFQASSVALLTVGYLKGRVWKTIATCILIALVITVFLTHSRGAMLAFLTFSVVYLALAGFRKLLFAGIISAAIVAIFVVTSHTFLYYIEDISRSLRLTAGLTMRDDLWWSALLLIRDYPITGVGIGCIKVVYSEYVRMTDPRFILMAHTPVMSGNVHNGYLAILAQFGMIGFGIIIWAISSTVRFLRMIRGAVPDTDMRLLFSFFAAVFVAVLVRGFYEATIAYGAMILSSLFVIPVGGALRLIVDRCSANTSEVTSE